MTSPGRILIVDDDPDFVDVYRQLLRRLGLEVVAVHTAEAALGELERAGLDLDVVLLDQKLQGARGPDSGLELIERVGDLAPLAKTIVVTAYASAEAIERAFRIGVYDYLVKNGAFEALLTAKVRNALEVTRSGRLAAQSREQQVAELRSTWAAVKIETQRHRKGALLEQLVQLLFRATPGFEQVKTNLRNESEEIDIVVVNRADDPLWKQDGGAYLIGECKNWSSPCDAAEFRNFYMKVQSKVGRVRTGFFIAPGGFTDGFRRELTRQARADFLIIPVDDADLDRWIEADDRHAILAELHEHAVFGK